ncbi:hypothetical protein PIIN_03801 [Serendipita indica DSM 11827]|uniref:Carbohydrate-binding module family 19 domain-containing protein n=1 Tax=Serendipita indica (strain DSM 11827) TaxID=1109443 RepID=G4TEW9_SERID|nr:hypothetical protein PIIN_03801 [Serendipita indica DSM 11827]
MIFKPYLFALLGASTLVAEAAPITVGGAAQLCSVAPCRMRRVRRTPEIMRNWKRQDDDGDGESTPPPPSTPDVGVVPVTSTSTIPVSQELPPGPVGGSTTPATGTNTTTTPPATTSTAVGTVPAAPAIPSTGTINPLTGQTPPFSPFGQPTTGFNPFGQPPTTEFTPFGQPPVGAVPPFGQPPFGQPPIGAVPPFGVPPTGFEQTGQFGSNPFANGLPPTTGFGTEFGANGQFGSTGQLGLTGQLGSTGQFGSTEQPGSTGQLGSTGSTGQFGSTGQPETCGPTGCTPTSATNTQCGASGCGTFGRDHEFGMPPSFSPFPSYMQNYAMYYLPHMMYSVDASMSYVGQLLGAAMQSLQSALMHVQQNMAAYGAMMTPQLHSSLGHNMQFEGQQVGGSHFSSSQEPFPSNGQFSNGQFGSPNTQFSSTGNFGSLNDQFSSSSNNNLGGASTASVHNNGQSKTQPSRKAGIAEVTPEVNTGAAAFQTQNARDAQGLNQKFKSITVGSPCTVGENACTSDGQFAQCPFGTFIATPCAAGTQCLALPLVLKPGTSIACSTLEDANRRMADAGASGGFDGQQGSGSVASNTGSTLQNPQGPSSTASTSAVSGENNAGGFQAQNARDAQGLNERFKSITVGSPCTIGENACTSDGQFAQCPFGTFIATPCSGGTKCFALPLVFKPGTSVTCSTLEDANRRMADAGVSGGFDGRQ